MCYPYAGTTEETAPVLPEDESRYPHTAQVEASSLYGLEQETENLQIAEELGGNTLSFFLSFFLSFLNLWACKYSPQTFNIYYPYLTEFTLSEILASSSRAVEVEPCQPRYPQTDSERPVTRQTTGSLPVPEPLQNITMAEELSSE